MSMPAGFPEEWKPGDRLLGTLAKPTKFKCGGWTGCDGDHSFLDPASVIVLDEAVPLKEFREHEHVWSQELEDKAVANNTLYIGKTVVVPTLLGMWLEAASVN